jgi:hypothetical protein
MTTPAGWYPNPSGSGGQRYFDGTRWTDHYAPAAGAVVPPPPPTPPQSTSRATKIVLALCGVAVLAVVIALVAVGSKAKDEDARLPNGRSSSAGATAPSDGGESSVAPARTAVRDGKFEFRILNFYSTKTVSVTRRATRTCVRRRRAYSPS